MYKCRDELIICITDVQLAQADKKYRLSVETVTGFFISSKYEYTSKFK